MIKKYENFINEKFKTIDYKIILKDLKDNPTTLITDFKIVKTESGKSEIKAKGYTKEKGGWSYFDDFKDNKTRSVWNKYFQNGIKKIKLITESNSDKILYPYTDIKYFVEWFCKNYSDEAEKQGWGVFDSDTAVPKEKYISNSKPYTSFWQIQHLEDIGILTSDEEADNLARKMGLMIDEYGLVIGYKGVSFLDNPEELDIYKNIRKYNV